MPLTDREILELNELCGAVIDDRITEAQRQRLQALLRESEAARRFYVRALGQSASLHSYAAETHAEAPDRPARGKLLRVSSWVAVTLLAAAALAFVFRATNPATPAVAGDARPNDFAARVTGVKDPSWATGATQLAAGALLRKGQQINLRAGYAELTFDSGARLILEGEASLEINSAWNATLRKGTLKASVPPEAVGFQVSNSAVVVVDLGTEFTMIADGRGAAEVLVLKGEVEASPRGAATEETFLIREKEARRFDPAGVSAVSESEKKFARFNEPLVLERFSPVIGFARWSFDETGDTAPADVAGLRHNAEQMKLTISGAANADAVRTEGWHGRALRFDGSVYARAAFPGLSSGTTRTIAFWARVPRDAQLSEAYSMVSWGLNSRRLGNRHVGINWNKNPAEGPIGALRTDFRGGHAIGTTSLRDGQWHHVVVVFAPGDENQPVHVTQYVDGRLESSGASVDTMRAAAEPGDREAMAALTDVLWLGCRLGVRGQTSGRFRGDIDELVVADRTLEPGEIVALMRDNRLPNTAVVSNP